MAEPVKNFTEIELTDLIEYLKEENSKLELEVGPVSESVDNYLITRNLHLFPERVSSICQDILGISSKTHYIYDELDSPSKQEFSKTGELIGASFYKLVERVTDEGSTDLTNTLLYTFPLYSTPQQLLDSLLERHDVPLPPLMSQTEKHQFTMRRIKQIQNKVASFLKKWIQLWPEQFKQGTELRESLHAFLIGLFGTSDALIRTNCRTIFSALQKVDEPEFNFSFCETRIPPSPQLPKEIDYRTEPLLLWHTTEIARQLTLIEFDLLKKVKISELLARQWEKPDRELKAPSVIAINKRFLRCRAFFINSVVSQAEVSIRVKVMKKLLEIAVECMDDLHNYESPFIITSALKSDALRSLEKTVRDVKKSTMHKILWSKLDDVYTSDFSGIRKEMRNKAVNVPCFLALRQELSRNDVLRSDFLSSGLINLAKHRITSEVLQRITSYQSIPPPYHRVASLYDYLSATHFSIDEENLTSISQRLES